MSILVDPTSEYGYHWHEVEDGDIVNTPDIIERRLAGFHDVLEHGDAMVEVSGEICGLDVLGAPGETKTRRLPGADLVKRGADAVKRIGPRREWKKTASPSKEKAARIHPVHAAPVAYKAAQRAQKAGTRALKAAARKPLQTVVHGDRGEHSILVGAAPGGRPIVVKKMTAKQKHAVEKFNKAVAKSKAAGKAAAKSGAEALAQAKKTGIAIKSASATVKAFMKKPTVMRGEDPPPVPDPTNPGFLTDGSPDPNYKGDAGGSGDAPVDVPVIPAVSLDQAVAKVPPDGVVYDGAQKGWPRYSFGSKKFFDMTDPNHEVDGPQPKNSNVVGFVYGWSHMKWPNSAEPKRWILRAGHDVFNNPSWHDVASGIDPVNPPDSMNPPAIAAGLGDLGPLIGRPGSEFAKLRWATADKKWFWYLEEAPEWATAELRYAAAKLKAEQDAADKKAADAEAKAAAKEKADQEAEQARQDAANALAEKQAESEAKVAETKRATEQAQLDLEARKAEQELAAQQAQLDLEWQRQQMEQMRQQVPTGEVEQPSDQFALPGESGFPPAGDATGPMDFDVSMDHASAAGQQEAEANPFSDLPEGAGMPPDWGDGPEESFDLPPGESMVGGHPGRGNAAVNFPQQAWRR